MSKARLSLEVPTEIKLRIQTMAASQHRTVTNMIEYLINKEYESVFGKLSTQEEIK